MTKSHLVFAFTCLMFTPGHGQKSNKLPRLIGEPMFTDTSSTIFFPVQYHEELLSANKIALGADYYANIIVYDILKDTYRKLFDRDTYIQAFRSVINYELRVTTRPINLTARWVFLLVKPGDYNANGRIDEKDPSVLFATTKTGDGLKRLTQENENVLSFSLYEKQGFGLIKIQRDTGDDRAFNDYNKDIYYRKISLNDLVLGKEIEIR